MLGAIIGDIIGSRFEAHNLKSKDFDLFTEDCCFTDDTVMTIAVADAIMTAFDDPIKIMFANDRAYDNYVSCLTDCLKKWGRNYPEKRYGRRFRGWLKSNRRIGYGSFGNGSAMRVSPCAWAVDITPFYHEGIGKVDTMAYLTSIPSHDHPEGIKGAQEVARAIWYMRYARSGDRDKRRQLITDQKELVVRHSTYDLNTSLNKIRKHNRYDNTCSGSVPQAIRSFLESNGFEDAIRNAVSIGGDSDTIAAMAGSIAEAAYGIPDNIKEEALGYLDDPIRKVLDDWRAYLEKINVLV